MSSTDWGGTNNSTTGQDLSEDPWLTCNFQVKWGMYGGEKSKTKKDLYKIAQRLAVKGRSVLDKAGLIAAIKQKIRKQGPQ
jgi:hypothetical protein